MQTIVLSLGGSVILSNDINEAFLRKISSLLNKLSHQYKIFIVAGGGNIARRYIKLGRELGIDEKKLDEIGVAITRVNAKLLATIIDRADKRIPKTTDEAKRINESIVVMGGTTPGHSTDMVAMELAEKVQADRVIIATNVDGIYNKDPHKYSDARQLKEVTIEYLIAEYGTKWTSAGNNIVIDGPSLNIIKRSKIPVVVVNGKRINQLEKAFRNQQFDGTKIKI